MIYPTDLIELLWNSALVLSILCLGFLKLLITFEKNIERA
jgi:hypothetical protein